MVQEGVYDMWEPVVGELRLFAPVVSWKENKFLSYRQTVNPVCLFNICVGRKLCLLPFPARVQCRALSEFAVDQGRPVGVVVLHKEKI